MTKDLQEFKIIISLFCADLTAILFTYTMLL